MFELNNQEIGVISTFVQYEITSDVWNIDSLQYSRQIVEAFSHLCKKKVIVYIWHRFFAISISEM